MNRLVLTDTFESSSHCQVALVLVKGPLSHLHGAYPNACRFKE